MAADMHIHVLEGITEDDIAQFNRSTLGSKYFDAACSAPYDAVACDAIEKTPNMWVGSVSWLKAALTDDIETYVPDPVMIVNDLIGEDLPEITDALIESVVVALQTPNTTDYTICTADEVLAFLQKHKGKRIFTISW